MGERVVDYRSEALDCLARISNGDTLEWSPELSQELVELTHVNGKMSAKAWMSRAFAALRDGRKSDVVLCFQGAAGRIFSQKEFARLRNLRVLTAADLEPARFSPETCTFAK